MNGGATDTPTLHCSVEWGFRMLEQ